MRRRVVWGIIATLCLAGAWWADEPADIPGNRPAVHQTD